MTTPPRIGACKDCGAVGILVRGQRCSNCHYLVDKKRRDAWLAKGNNLQRKRSVNRAWRDANPEKVKAAKERHRNRLESDPAFRREKHDWRLMHFFGLSREMFDSLLLSQSGRCSICLEPLNGDGAAQSRNGLHVDHDHSTGKVRGLLCGSCNVALGHLRDSPELCEAAARYLCEHRPVLRLVR